MEEIKIKTNAIFSKIPDNARDFVIKVVGNPRLLARLLRLAAKVEELKGEDYSWENLASDGNSNKRERSVVHAKKLYIAADIFEKETL